MARKSRKHLQNIPVDKKSACETKPFIAGIYARTSSEEQKGDSIANQEKIGMQYIESNDGIRFYKLYTVFTKCPNRGKNTRKPLTQIITPAKT